MGAQGMTKASRYVLYSNPRRRLMPLQCDRREYATFFLSRPRLFMYSSLLVKTIYSLHVLDTILRVVSP